MNLETLKGISYKAKYKRILRVIIIPLEKPLTLANAFQKMPQIKHYIF